MVASRPLFSNGNYRKKNRFIFWRGEVLKNSRKSWMLRFLAYITLHRLSSGIYLRTQMEFALAFFIIIAALLRI